MNEPTHFVSLDGFEAKVGQTNRRKKRRSLDQIRSKEELKTRRVFTKSIFCGGQKKWEKSHKRDYEVNILYSLMKKITRKMMLTLILLYFYL